MAGITDNLGQLARNFLWTFRWALAVAAIAAVCLLAGLNSARNRAQAAKAESESQRQHQAASEARKVVEEANAAVVRQQRAEQAERERQAKAAAEAKAAKLAAVAEAEMEYRKHITRNLRSTATFRTPGKLAVAVAVANSEGRLDEGLAAQLAALLPTSRVIATGGLFTPAFAADGVLQKLLGSENSEMARLGLQNLTDHLLLGSYRVRFSTNTQLGGIITANLQFDASALKSDSGVVQEKLNVEISGAGFGNDMAESAAKERLITALSSRTWQFLSQ